MRGPDTASVVGGVAALAGLGALASSLPLLEHRFEAVDFLGGWSGRHVGHLGAALSGLFLLFLAGQLRRRRHRAWQLAAMLLVLATLSHAVRELDWKVALGAVPLVLLLGARRSFQAPSDPPTLFRLGVFAACWVAVVLILGVGSLWLGRAELTPPFTIGRTFQAIVAALGGQPSAYRYANPFFERAFRDTLVMLSIVGGATSVWLACRPIVQRPTRSAEEWRHARAIVAEWGTDTLSYFALRRDKSFFFSSDGRALIAYGYFAGYARASGDPIGAPESQRLAIAEFLAMCRSRGWGIGFLAVHETMLPLYTEHGLKGTYLGDEAVLDCGRFHLEGHEMRPVRLPVQKLEERGFRFELIEETRADANTLAQLRRIATAQHPGEHEHGFTMALGEPVSGRNEGLLLAIARDASGTPLGLLRFVPCHGGEPAISLDLMRRAPEAPNGIIEYLIAQSAFAARAHGVRRISLNFAAYGRLLEGDLPLTLFERVLRALVLRTDPFFQTRSLWTFNRKFRPDWVPRSLVYERTATFPRVALCYVVAEGFIRIPILGPLLVAQPR